MEVPGSYVLHGGKAASGKENGNMILLNSHGFFMASFIRRHCPTAM